MTTNNDTDKVFDHYRDMVNRFKDDLGVSYIGNFPAIGGKYLQWFGDAGLCVIKTTSAPHVKMLKSGEQSFPYLDEVLKEIASEKDVDPAYFKPLALSKLGNILYTLQHLYGITGSSGCNFTAKLSDDLTTVGLNASFGQLRTERAKLLTGAAPMAYMVKFNQLFLGFSGNKASFNENAQKRLDDLTACRKQLTHLYDTSKTVFFKENEDYGLAPTQAMLETVKFYDIINKLFNNGAFVTNCLRGEKLKVKDEIDKVFNELTVSKKSDVDAIVGIRLL